MTLAAVHHILPLTTIVRERRLPIPGVVRIRPGQRVQPGDVVADATWAREHIFIDVARVLGLTAVAADRIIRLKAGDTVPAGFVVARGGGMLPKTVRVPRAGKVVAAGAGQILMEAASRGWNSGRASPAWCVR